MPNTNDIELELSLAWRREIDQHLKAIDRLLAQDDRRDNGIGIDVLTGKIQAVLDYHGDDEFYCQDATELADMLEPNKYNAGGEIPEESVKEMRTAQVAHWAITDWLANVLSANGVQEVTK